MKKSWKVIYLFILLITVESFFAILSGIKKEVPNNINDRDDLVLTDFQNSTTNNMEYHDGKWTIIGEDPYIVIGNVNKYIDGIDIIIADKKENIRWGIYYNTGKGFNQSEFVGSDKKNDGLYRVYLKRNILDIRLDIEGLSEGEIGDLKVVFHNGFNWFKRSVIRIVIFYLLLFLLCSAEIIYDVFVKNTSLSISAVQVFISAFFIGMTSRAIFRTPLNIAIVFFLMDAMVVLACMFFDGFGKKKDFVEVENE